LLEPAAAHAAKNRLARLEGDVETARRLGLRGMQPGRAPWRAITGASAFRRVIEVSQDPIGQTPRSTPATYIGAFNLIREIFAQLPEARMRGHDAGWFSFNRAGGRCETCGGAGRIKLEMNFLPEAWLPCDDCNGDRYGPELRELRWNGKNLAEVLRMSFAEAAQFFSAHKILKGMLDLMVETGLGYLTLGQSSPTLSGGEAQRLKLVSELALGLPGPHETDGPDPRGGSRHASRSLYIMEEPTIGLHQSDVVRLIDLLHRLVEQGHTVIVIEHHVDLIAEADWVLELGPDGGEAGGHIMYQGTVAGLAARRDCPTGPYLREKL
jgi:excinuclease ABC subunit A